MVVIIYRFVALGKKAAGIASFIVDLRHAYAQRRYKVNPTALNIRETI